MGRFSFPIFPKRKRIEERGKMELTIGLLIPFLGTSRGSAMVFLMKND